MKVSCSNTNSDGLRALIVRHVDGGSGGAGDNQWRVQQIQFDRDITARGTIVVAHLDLERLGRISLCDFMRYSFSFTATELKSTKTQRMFGV